MVWLDIKDIRGIRYMSESGLVQLRWVAQASMICRILFINTLYLEREGMKIWLLQRK